MLKQAQIYSTLLPATDKGDRGTQYSHKKCINKFAEKDIPTIKTSKKSKRNENNTLRYTNQQFLILFSLCRFKCNEYLNLNVDIFTTDKPFDDLHTH